MSKIKRKAPKKKVKVSSKANTPSHSKSENQVSSTYIAPEPSKNSPYQILKNLGEEDQQRLRLAVAKQLLNEIRGNLVPKTKATKSFLKIYKPEDFYEALCFMPGGLAVEYVTNELNVRLEKLGSRKVAVSILQASARRQVTQAISGFQWVAKVMGSSFAKLDNRLEAVRKNME